MIEKKKTSCAVVCTYPVLAKITHTPQFPPPIF
jgi:hypothetical protein